MLKHSLRGSGLRRAQFESLRPLFARERKALPPVPQLVADSLPSLREVSAAVLRTATGIGTSQSSVRIPSPALFVMLLNSAWSLALMLQTRACCAAHHLMKVCTSVQTLKGSLAPIAPISRSQVQESRFCSPRREVHLSRARSFARVAR